MKSIVKSAKTIEEAISLALEELNVTEEEVSIEVLEEPSKGFLGIIGTKPAKVEVKADKTAEYIINKLLSELLEKMQIEGNIKTSENKNDIYVEIVDLSSSDEGILIGKRGSTLDAIQYYLTVVLNKYVKGYRKVVLNVADYREKREQTLIDLANKLANSVVRNRKTIRLEPMNPYERKIIHSTLQNDNRVTTFSEGEEPNRRLVIQLNR